MREDWCMMSTKEKGNDSSESGRNDESLSIISLIDGFYP